MKKIGWLIVVALAALFLFAVLSLFVFTERIGSEEKKSGKDGIEELVNEQANTFMILFSENQRVLRILDRISCIRECEELEKFRKLAETAHDDLLDAVELINGIPGEKDEKVVFENIKKIQEKLDWVALTNRAINNFFRTIIVPQPPQPIKRLKKDIVVSLPSAHPSG